MYKVFSAILTIIWILDVTNMPFMVAMDNKYPVNTLAWFLIFACLPTINNNND